MSVYNEFDMDEVMDGVARGRKDAFMSVVRTYGLPIRSYLASQIYHIDDVDDIAQEVFITAYKRLHTFRRGEDVGAWLRGIARNKLLNYYRSSSRRNNAVTRFRTQVVEIVGDELEDVSKTDKAEQIEMLMRCIGKLPERMRRVVTSSLEGGKPQALAEEMETSVGAIYNLQYRANQALRTCMTKELARVEQP